VKEEMSGRGKIWKQRGMKTKNPTGCGSKSAGYSVTAEFPNELFQNYRLMNDSLTQ